MAAGACLVCMVFIRASFDLHIVIYLYYTAKGTGETNISCYLPMFHGIVEKGGYNVF